MRTLIAGAPRAGKTTMAKAMAEQRGVTLRHTDDAISLGWSSASEEAARWIDDPGPWVIEGVAVPRALRKWISAYPGKPCDVIVWLGTPRVPLTPGQAAMAKGCVTVWDEIRPELVARGVQVRSA